MTNILTLATTQDECVSVITVDFEIHLTSIACMNSRRHQHPKNGPCEYEGAESESDEASDDSTEEPDTFQILLSTLLMIS